jgi:hypothetical protein
VETLKETKSSHVGSCSAGRGGTKRRRKRNKRCVEGRKSAAATRHRCRCKRRFGLVPVANREGLRTGRWARADAHAKTLIFDRGYLPPSGALLVMAQPEPEPLDR